MVLEKSLKSLEFSVKYQGLLKYFKANEVLERALKCLRFEVQFRKIHLLRTLMTLFLKADVSCVKSFSHELR